MMGALRWVSRIGVEHCGDEAELRTSRWGGAVDDALHTELPASFQIPGEGYGIANKYSNKLKDYS